MNTWIRLTEVNSEGVFYLDTRKIDAVYDDKKYMRTCVYVNGTVFEVKEDVNTVVAMIAKAGK